MKGDGVGFVYSTDVAVRLVFAGGESRQFCCNIHVEYLSEYGIRYHRTPIINTSRSTGDLSPGITTI